MLISDVQLEKYHLDYFVSYMFPIFAVRQRENGHVIIELLSSKIVNQYYFQNVQGLVLHVFNTVFEKLKRNPNFYILILNDVPFCSKLLGYQQLRLVCLCCRDQTILNMLNEGTYLHSCKVYLNSLCSLNSLCTKIFSIIFV